MKLTPVTISLLVIALALFVLPSCNRGVNKYFISSENTESQPGLKQHNFNKVCNNQMNYVPDEEDPMRYLRINIHFLRNNEGGNNFSIEQGLRFGRELVDGANLKLSQNTQMNLPPGNNTPVEPIGYRYKLVGEPAVPGDEGIYFHDDDETAYYDYKRKQETLFSGKFYHRYGVQKGEVLNMFLIEFHPDSLKSPGYKHTGHGVGTGKWAVVVDAWRSALDSIDWEGNGEKVLTWVWAKVGLFNHEVGHCLGLPHTWGGYDGCDDTPSHPNCWNKTASGPCKTQWSNNMMDYNAHQIALTPCQIGKIHKNFARVGSVQRNMLEPTWCNYKPFEKVHIRNDSVVWNCHKDVESDIIIHPGATLTFRCRVSMPPGSKIEVRPGAELILDGSYVHNDCGEQWDGIEVWESKEDGKGKVTLLNDAVIADTRFPKVKPKENDKPKP